MPSKSKEKVIVLPNGDECPAGKIKDETKLLNLVSAEYGIGQDISFFHLQKQKNRYNLKLIFIPRHVGELHSDNAKKFVTFELIRNGINCTIRINDDLNKRAQAILDLVNNKDPNAKETVRAKLSAIIDVAEELEQITDLLLSDAQFNSFKYSVLNNKKMTCLLCVNSHGIYARALDDTFEVQDSVMWTDISNITSKQKKINIHKHNGEIFEIICLNSKMARVADAHLCRYLKFKCSIVPQQPLGWLGRISLRIRKSFSRRATLHTSTNQPAINSSELEKPKSIKPMPSHSLAPSTVPESSFISEDIMENPISIVEPSLKTNSTYDVSLGSDNSYRPTLTSLSTEELSHNQDKISSFQKASLPPADDHISLNTTSTYEVSLDSRQLVRPMSSDNDSSSNTGQTQLSSFGNSSTRVSPPLAPVRKDIIPMELDKGWSRPSVTNPEEPIVTEVKEPEFVVRYFENVIEPEIDSKVNFSQSNDQLLKTSAIGIPTATESPLKQIPPELPKHGTSDTCYIKIAPEPPIRTISDQSNGNNSKDNQEQADQIQPPPPPIRAAIITSDMNKKLAMFIEQIKEEETIIAINDPILESNISRTTMPVSEAYSVITTSMANEMILPEETIVLPTYVPLMLSENYPPPAGSPAKEIPESPVENQLDFFIIATPLEPSLDTAESIQEPVKENILSENVDFEKKEKSENEIENTQICELKSDSRLPISKQRSIPSPKIQRPSRVSVKGFPSPKEERKEFLSGIPIQMAQSPSDKENYENNKDKIGHDQTDHNGGGDEDINNDIKTDTERPSSNFSRFEGQECKVDSKTTYTSVTTVGDSIVKKSTQTEISSVKSTGIPTPKQYKSTTTITTTVKKPADVSKSPVISGTKIPTGIPRMSSK